MGTRNVASPVVWSVEVMVPRTQGSAAMWTASAERVALGIVTPAASAATHLFPDLVQGHRRPTAAAVVHPARGRDAARTDETPPPRPPPPAAVGRAASVQGRALGQGQEVQSAAVTGPDAMLATGQGHDPLSAAEAGMAGARAT